MMTLAAGCGGPPDVAGDWLGKVSSSEDPDAAYDLSMQLVQGDDDSFSGNGNFSYGGENSPFQIESGSIDDDGSFSFLVEGSFSEGLRFDGDVSSDHMEGDVLGGGEQGAAKFEADR